MREELQKLTDRCILYRGTILHRCTYLEKEIELYMLHHFSSPKNVISDIGEVIMPKISFDGKISCFQEILKRNVGDDVFSKKYEKLFSELRYVKDVRNKMAHWPMYTNYGETEKIPKEFSLINFYNSIDIKPFTKGDFDQFTKRLHKCREIIYELLP